MDDFLKNVTAIADQRALLREVRDALKALAGEQQKVREEAVKTRKMQESANKATAEQLELQKI